MTEDRINTLFAGGEYKMAGQFDSREIIVGAASVYLNNTNNLTGDNSTTGRPAFPAGASYRTTLDADANWRNVGYTMEGLEIAYEPDYGDVEVDQLLDSAMLFKQSQKLSLNTTFAQATLLNLLVAWGQGSSTLNSTASQATLDVDGGSLGDAPVERSLIAVGNATRVNSANGSVYNERVYHAYRILQVEQSTYGMKRSENTGIPVSFRALPATSGKYAQMVDRVRTW